MASHVRRTLLFHSATGHCSQRTFVRFKLADNRTAVLQSDEIKSISLQD